MTDMTSETPLPGQGQSFEPEQPLETKPSSEPEQLFGSEPRSPRQEIRVLKDDEFSPLIPSQTSAINAPLKPASRVAVAKLHEEIDKFAPPLTEV